MDRNTLFPDKTPHKRHSRLLFDLPPHSTAPCDPASTAVGDHVHNLADHQIEKLIALKFGGNAVGLVRQLSMDLAAKEQELIMLRQQKFRREHELYRLCEEYGNLSSLEVDQRLDSLGEASVYGVLAQMISAAVEEPQRSVSPPVLERNAPAELPQDRGSSLGILVSRRQSMPTHLESRRHSRWFHWLSLSEESVAQPKTGLSRLRSLYRGELSKAVDAERPPVELGKFSSLEAGLAVLSDTDKFGFYNNINGTRSPRQEESPPSVNDLSISDITIVRLPSDAGEIGPSKLSKSMDKLKRLKELNDAKSERTVKAWDAFMRRLMAEHAVKSLADAARDVFGAKALALKMAETKSPDTRFSKYFGHDDERTKTDESASYRNLCHLVQEEGIPSKYRNTLWYDISGAKSKCVPGEYSALVQMALEPGLAGERQQIELDLHRTLPSNKFFYDVATAQPGPHLEKLQNILHAFVAYRPQLGYSQGMNKIVGNLLLGVNESNTTGAYKLDEEDVFWIFVSMVEDVVPVYGGVNFFDQRALPFIQRDVKLTAKVIFPRFLPEMARHFAKLHVEIEVVMLSWWLGLFTESVAPVDTWLKIVDSLLLSENVTIRIIALSLGILKMFESGVLEMADAGEVYRFVEKLRQGTVNMRFQELSQISSGFESRLSWAEIERERKKCDYGDDERA